MKPQVFISKFSLHTKPRRNCLCYVLDDKCPRPCQSVRSRKGSNHSTCKCIRYFLEVGEYIRLSLYVIYWTNSLKPSKNKTARHYATENYKMFITFKFYSLTMIYL